MQIRPSRNAKIKSAIFVACALILYAALLVGLVMAFDIAETNEVVRNSILWAFGAGFIAAVAAVIIWLIREWKADKVKLQENASMCILLILLLASIHAYQNLLSMVTEHSFALRASSWLDEHLIRGIGIFYYKITQYSDFWWTSLRLLLGLSGFGSLLYLWYSIAKFLMLKKIR